MKDRPNRSTSARTDETNWSAMERDPEYRKLRVMQRWYVIPASVVALGFYLVFLVVAVSAPGAVTGRLFGGVNVAYALMIVIFLLVWAAVIGYVFLANRRWDDQVDRVVEAAERAGREPVSSSCDPDDDREAEA